MFQWQKYHIFDEMKQHNCFFEIIDPSDFSSVKEANEEIFNKLKSGNYDLFMTCLGDLFFDLKELKIITSMGVRSLLFCPDNLKVPFAHKKICKYFSLVWLTSKETEYLFKRWSAKTIFMPYAANPNFLKYDSDYIENSSIGFIGTPYGSRTNTINYLTKNDIPVCVHANIEKNTSVINASFTEYSKAIFYYLRFRIGFKLFLAALINKLKRGTSIDLVNRKISIMDSVDLTNLDKYNRVYSLTLSFGDAGHTGILKKPVDVVNLRNFEIPMSGGLEFTRYTKELSNYFEEGKEIIFYKSKKEMIDKARYYLSEDMKDTRERMKKAARLRAEREHTWYCRFKKIFEILEIGE